MLLIKRLLIWIMTSRLTVKAFLWTSALFFYISHLLYKNYYGQLISVLGSRFFLWLETFEFTLVNSSKNRHLRQRGLYFPTLQTWFITADCTRRCAGCPKVGNCAEKMTESDWVRLGEEAIENGAMVIMVLGGEPLLKKQMIRNIKQKLGRRILFIVYTNGDLFAEQDAKDFSRLGIALAINIGSGRKDDSNAVRAFTLAKKHRVLTGASITITQQNYTQVISHRYINYLVSMGAVFVSFFHYIPVGVKEDEIYTLNQESFMKVERGLANIKGPIYTTSYSTCRAGFAEVSIDPDGSVKPCAFCSGEGSIGNCLDSTILEIFNGKGGDHIRQINANSTCILFSSTDNLEGDNFIPKHIAAALRKCSYLSGYWRKPKWWRSVINMIRDWAFGYG